MSKGAIITLAVLVVAIVGGLMGKKMQNQGRASLDARQAAVVLIQSSPTYKQHQSYIDGLIDEHHAPAFALAYTSGGLASQADYDEEVYFAELWTRVAASAERDKREDVVQILPGQAKAKQQFRGISKPTG